VRRRVLTCSSGNIGTQHALPSFGKLRLRSFIASRTLIPEDGPLGTDRRHRCAARNIIKVGTSAFHIAFNGDDPHSCDLPKPRSAIGLETHSPLVGWRLCLAAGWLGSPFDTDNPDHLFIAACVPRRPCNGNYPSPMNYPLRRLTPPRTFKALCGLIRMIGLYWYEPFTQSAPLK
jgi:hypothetical protein